MPKDAFLAFLPRFPLCHTSSAVILLLISHTQRILLWCLLAALTQGKEAELWCQQLYQWVLEIRGKVVINSNVQMIILCKVKLPCIGFPSLILYLQLSCHCSFLLPTNEHTKIYPVIFHFRACAGKILKILHTILSQRFGITILNLRLHVLQFSWRSQKNVSHPCSSSSTTYSLHLLMTLLCTSLRNHNSLLWPNIRAIAFAHLLNTLFCRICCITPMSPSCLWGHHHCHIVLSTWAYCFYICWFIFFWVSELWKI